MRYCRLSSGSACEATPPDAMILMWSAPLRSSSRVALITSGTPSATRAVQDRPEQQAQNFPVCGAQPVIAVAAGLAQRLAGDEQARAFEQALLDRGLDAVVGAAGVAQRGEAAMQHGAHGHRAFGGEQRQRHVGQQAQVDLGEHDMDVRVDQARASACGRAGRCAWRRRWRSGGRRPPSPCRPRPGRRCRPAARPCADRGSVRR